MEGEHKMQNYETNFTKNLDRFNYLKVKTINNQYKCIFYHHNENNKNVGVVFCFTFPTLSDAIIFATNFDLQNGKL